MDGGTLTITPPAAPVRRTVLGVDHVTVRFPKLVAVRDVSLELDGGDLLGLIGPNGAGKTTLLRTLCGLQQPTSGVVRIHDEVLTADRDDLLAFVGFTPDSPPVYDNLTIRQFLHFIALGYDLPRHEAEERIAFWLEKVWLAEKADVKLKVLSRGMKQRVGIARTLLANPSLIVLDEPAAGLDPAGRVQFRQLLCDLRDQGQALVVSSHILSDMADYCTHIGIMSGGRLVKCGTVAEVTNMHGTGRCRYTVRFATGAATTATGLVAALPGVANVTPDRGRLTFEYADDPAAAAALLAELVATHKLPVAEFTPHPANLEEAYLRAGVGQVD